MAVITVICPHCKSDKVYRNGYNRSGAERFRCRNPECRRSFQIVYKHAAYKPETRRLILEMSINGSGHRDIRRTLHVGSGTITKTLKKNQGTPVSDKSVDAQ